MPWRMPCPATMPAMVMAAGRASASPPRAAAPAPAAPSLMAPLAMLPACVRRGTAGTPVGSQPPGAGERGGLPAGPLGVSGPGVPAVGVPGAPGVGVPGAPGGTDMPVATVWAAWSVPGGRVPYCWRLASLAIPLPRAPVLAILSMAWGLKGLPTWRTLVQNRLMMNFHCADSFPRGFPLFGVPFIRKKAGLYWIQNELLSIPCLLREDERRASFDKT